MQLKEKMIYILRVNTTLIVLVHPYNEKTEGGRLLREHTIVCRKIYKKLPRNRGSFIKIWLGDPWGN